MDTLDSSVSPASTALELRTPYDINSFDYHEARLRAAGHSNPPPRARRKAIFDWVAEDLPQARGAVN